MKGGTKTLLRVGVLAADRLERVAGALAPERAPGPPDTATRIIIWTMDRVGDVQRATPALRQLARRFPGARCTAVAAGRSAPILERNPHLAELVVVPSPYDAAAHLRVIRRLRRTTWDLGVLAEVDPFWAKLGQWTFRALGVRQWVGFDLGLHRPARQRSVILQPGQSWVEQFRSLAEAAGAADEGPGMELHVSEAERADAALLLARHGIGAEQPFLLIHPGGNAMAVSRQWQPDRYGRLLDLVAARWGCPIVVTGVESERPVIERIRASCTTGFVDLSGALNLRGLAAVIERATLCVMGDTGPLHMAHALRRPTVAIVGPTAPWVIGLPPESRAVYVELACRPCVFLQGWQACTNPETLACLARISPQAVFDAVVEQVAARSIALAPARAA